MPKRFGEPHDVVAEIKFGHASAVPPVEWRGLSMLDREGSWTEGGVSGFTFEVPPGRGHLLLQMSLTPYVDASGSQRLTVMANGHEIGSASLMRPGVVAFYLPVDCIAAARVEITLVHPDAVSPFEIGVSSDRRQLAFFLLDAVLIRVAPPRSIYTHARPPLPNLFRAGPDQLAAAVGALSGLSIADLMLAFESLGHNREFGLVQRHWGAEPLGLLRFVDIDPEKLLLGLNWGFADVEAPEGLRVFLDKRRGVEFLVQQRRYHFVMTTFRTKNEANAESVKAEAGRSLKFMRRKFLENLQSGQKICVVQGAVNLTLAEARAISMMLRSFGPVSLLFVTRGPAHLSGSVSSVEDGIMQGVIDEFADFGRNEPAINEKAWLSICANSYRLWRESGFGVE